MNVIAQLYQQGGATLVVIAFLSVLALAVGLERFFATWTHGRRLATAGERIMAHLQDNNRTMATAVNQSLPWHPGTVILGKVLADKPPAQSELRRQLAAALRQARRRLWILASIGAIAPFVGLLGTVLGVMEAFHDIGESGAGGFQTVSGGISEALIATAGGIFVGIEAVVLFNILQVVVGDYCARLKESVEQIYERAAEVPHVAAAP